MFEGSEDVLLTSEERFTQGKQLLDLITNIHSAIQGNSDFSFNLYSSQRVMHLKPLLMLSVDKNMI